MAVHLVGDAVAEVGERLRARREAGLDVRRARRERVPERDGDALRRKRLHERGHPRHLRRDIDEADRTFRRVLEAMEEREVGRAHPFDRMRADSAGPVGDERALQEEAENVPLADGIRPPRGNDRANRREQHFGVARDKRRQIAGRAVRREALRDGLDRLDGQSGRVEVHARIAVHLQVDPARRRHLRALFHASTIVWYLTSMLSM